MTLEEMLNIVSQRSRRTLNQEQRNVVEAEGGPLWVIAGPGSGKSEVLVLKALHLTCVRRVQPRAIVLTTFTDKAARNIQDRLILYKAQLDEADSSVRDIDLFQLRVGTLHSLCNDIMQETRYPAYQNYRLLDELDQLLFVYEHSSLAASQPDISTHLPFWRAFDFLVSRYSRVSGYRWSARQSYLPHRWLRTEATATIFNRIAEDRINVQTLRTGGPTNDFLADAYGSYRQSLENNLCCDFAHLQQKFLEFLNSELGRRLIAGDGTADNPGIRHVLVDEYQDTNPVQEEIYLSLAGAEPHNLCVVGDDDQALYRFRGGTVECMVNFDTACARQYGQPISINRLPLSTNFRSEPSIVTWCDEYITSFTVMSLPGARVPGKATLRGDQNWANVRTAQGAQLLRYPSVSFISSQTDDQLAEDFARTVRGLLDGGTIQAPQQCVLLMKSTQETYSGRYRRALNAQGIQVYNPRSRSLLEEEEVQTALGCLVQILDPRQSVLNQISSRNIQDRVMQWLAAANNATRASNRLADYIRRSISRIAATQAGQTVTQETTGAGTFRATIQEILYHILSQEPFSAWEEDPERTTRIGIISQVLESYCSVPFANSFGSTRGVLKCDPMVAGQLHPGQLNHFYNALVGLLVTRGLNDPEEDDVICPPGRLPIMTVHQSKGLEFPFVFVAGIGVQNAQIGTELQLEEALRPFRTSYSAAQFSSTQRAEQDLIRFFFVAYSRAEYALVLLTTDRDVTRQGLGFGGLGRRWFERQVGRV